MALGIGVSSPNMGTDLPGWVPNSLQNFNLNGQGTMAMAAEAHMDTATGHLGEV